MVELAQKSFSAGELTPSLYARSDLSRYSIGLRTMVNFFTMKQGGAANRPGSQFIVEVKDSTKTVRLIPFIFNNDQTYILEFGDLYMRVLKDGAQVGAPFELVTPYAEADLPTLTFAQNADVMTIAHRNYAPRELARLADDNWTLTTITFAPTIATPTLIYHPGGIIVDPNKPIIGYQVTAVGSDGEESLPVSVNVHQTDTNSTAVNFGWNPVSGAIFYRVYRDVVSSNGVNTYNLLQGLIGEASGTQFQDNGQSAEPDQPPQDLSLFQSAGDFPGAVAYLQNRLAFASSDNDPETLWLSRIGNYKNFTRRFPIQDDDSMSFTLVGRQVSQVKHLLELSRLITLTSLNEWIIKGNDAGVVIPSSVNASLQTENGSGDLRPIIVNGTVLYIQARANIVRDFLFDFELESYRGNDLGIYSSHLFESKTIVDWSYQQTPHSIVWSVRSDGTLLGLTYIREEQMLAWHRHTFENGVVENVAVVPEGSEDKVYLVIKRTINGSTVRYIERFNSRDFTDIKDAIFLDSSLSYDGRNTDTTHTMTLSGGTDWDHDETLTLTSSQSFFAAGDVGNAIHIRGSDGTLIRLFITGFTSDLIVTGKPDITVPVSMRSAAISDWDKAVDELSGLDHLEGETVGVMGDGFVVHSPKNAAYPTKTVVSGAITLDRPYGVIHVGLPITADIETLNIDSPQSTTANRKHLVTEVSLFVEASRGIFAGVRPPPDGLLKGLKEVKIPNQDVTNEPVPLTTDWVNVQTESKYTNNGRVFIRQVDPLPLKILAIVPGGYIPI